MKLLKKFRGFTIIEMMVVVAIIGALATVGLSTLNEARAKARDAIRVTDVRVIADALLAHDLEYEHWIENGYGEHDGQGYFNIAAAGYGGGGGLGQSMAERLVETEIMEREIVDPSGAKGSDVAVNYNGYMKYHCPAAPAEPQIIYVYARLETAPQSGSATDGTCCPDCDTLYNMNYYLEIPAGT